MMEQKISEVIFAYTVAYLMCQDEGLRLDKIAYEQLVDRLAKQQNKDNPWNWVRDKLKAGMLRIKIEKCEMQSNSDKTFGT